MFDINIKQFCIYIMDFNFYIIFFYILVFKFSLFLLICLNHAHSKSKRTDFQNIKLINIYIRICINFKKLTNTVLSKIKIFFSSLTSVHINRKSVLTKFLPVQIKHFQYTIFKSLFSYFFSTGHDKRYQCQRITLLKYQQ